MNTQCEFAAPKKKSAASSCVMRARRRHIYESTRGCRAQGAVGVETRFKRRIWLSSEGAAINCKNPNCTASSSKLAKSG